MKRVRPAVAVWLSLLLVLLVTACQKKTGELSPALQARFDQEGVQHRAEDLTFRRTKLAGDKSWDEKRASLVVTRESVFLHVNGQPLVEITPRSTGQYEVSRDHDRISLRAGSGKSAASWSFRPPDPAEADAWTTDIRAVIKHSKAR